MNSAAFSNKILRRIINNYDFIIRLFYCKMRFYKLVRFLLPDVYNSDFESLSSYFKIMYDMLQRHGYAVAGKSVLELGPGTSLISAYNFLSYGAKRVLLVDKYPRQNMQKKYLAYKKDELNYFKWNNSTGVLDFIDADTDEPRPERMRFIAGDLCDIELDEKVDFIYSIAVLHHVRGIEQVVRRMHEILNEGGMMYHVVDLKDKFHFFGSPFLFYKYSDFVWDNLLTDEAVTYTNRVRFQEYADLFDKVGFDIVWRKTISHDVPDFKINKKFLGRTDLDIGDAHFLLRKR